MSGDVTEADYRVLAAAVESEVVEFGSVSLLLDLTGSQWEKVTAWGSDLHFGHEYQDKIDRMALVGNRTWGKYLASLCSSFHARESHYFENADEGWWLESA